VPIIIFEETIMSCGCGGKAKKKEIKKKEK
jgi:hypothetical protein